MNVQWSWLKTDYVKQKVYTRFKMLIREYFCKVGMYNKFITTAITYSYPFDYYNTIVNEKINIFYHEIKLSELKKEIILIDLNNQIQISYKIRLNSYKLMKVLST